MILKYELEAFCKEIEAKLPSLEGKAYENAKDKVHILNRVNIEFMDYEDLLRKLALQNNDIKCDYWKLQVQMRDMKSQLKAMEEELRILKENIK